MYIYIYMSIPDILDMLKDLEEQNNPDDKEFIKEYRALFKSGIKLPGGVVSGIVAQISIRGDTNRTKAKEMEELSKKREERLKKNETKHKQWEIQQGVRPNVIQVVLNENLPEEELEKIANQVMEVVNTKKGITDMTLEGNKKSMKKLDKILKEVSKEGETGLDPYEHNEELLNDGEDEELCSRNQTRASDVIDMEGLVKAYGEDNIDPGGNYRPGWKNGKVVPLQTAVKDLKEFYANKYVDTKEDEDATEVKVFDLEGNQVGTENVDDEVLNELGDLSPQDQYEDEMKKDRLEKLKDLAMRLYSAKETWRLYQRLDADIRKIAKKMDIKMTELRGKADKGIAPEVQRLMKALKIR